MHSLGPSGVVQLAELERSGFVESVHLGAAVVVNGHGETLVEHGDVDALIYPRSSTKALQAIGMLRAGLALSGEQLVLAAASHLGTPRHVRVVRDILATAGLTEDALQCPADWPADPASRANAAAPERITMVCSGKHAAMLLTCVRNGWPTESYLDPGHPLQVALRETVEDLTGEAVGHVGVDGCGAPVFAISLRALARAIGRVGAGVDEHARLLSSAILANSWAVDNHRALPEVIDGLGIIAKTGAEGVFVASTPEGTAVALKIIDGSSRALVPVGLSLLAGVGAVDAEAARRVTQETTEKVLGAGRVVGELRAVV